MQPLEHGPLVAKSRCHFHALPAELRDQIYSFVVTADVRITITEAGYTRSGLLSTCRAVRYEALAMYYSNRLLQKFVALIPTTTEYQCDIHFTYRMGAATPTWQNLLAWLKESHESEHMMTQIHVEDPTLAGPEILAVTGLFSQVCESREVPWIAVSEVVKAQKPLLENLDPL